VPADSVERALGRLEGTLEALSRRIDDYRAEGRADRHAMRDDLAQRIDGVGARVEAISARVGVLELPSEPPPRPPSPSHPDATGQHQALPPAPAGTPPAVTVARWGVIAATLPALAPWAVALAMGALAARGCVVASPGRVGPPAASAGRP
jgi:hypothetical protein